MNVVKVVLVVWLLLIGSNAVAACPNPFTVPYTIQAGDNLWSLAQVKLQDPLKWVSLEAQNPILRDRTRYSIDGRGRLIVLIKPGETLCGLEEAGVSPNDFATSRPDSWVAPGYTGDYYSQVSLTEAQSQAEDGRDDGMPWYFLFLSLLLILAGLAIAAFARWLKSPERVVRATNTDPATAGPPMVPGGVTEVNAEQALRDVAARRFGGTHQDFTVLERTAGRVYGTVVVSYRDNTERQWVMSGQQAYQARIRRPNGHVEVVYMLQACGNDLRFGQVAGYRPGDDFRFEPEVVQPAPAPVVEPVVAPPAPAAVVPVAVPEPQRVAAEPTPRGTVQVVVKAPDGNGPHLVQVSGINPVGASIKVSPTGFELRYTELAP